MELRPVYRRVDRRGNVGKGVFEISDIRQMKKEKRGR